MVTTTLHAVETSRPRGERFRSRGFTLVELTVSIGVIVLLVTLTLPAVTRLWENSKLSDAQNAIQGRLMSARSDALGTKSGEKGLLFLLDTGVSPPIQRIVPIEQLTGSLGGVSTEKVFVISGEDAVDLAAPIRVVPRYASESSESGTENYAYFDAVELANENFLIPTGDPGQRHRNYFTIVFTPAGELVTGREVLIADVLADESQSPSLGEFTKLPVMASVSQYYKRKGPQAPIDEVNGLDLTGLLHPRTGEPLGIVADGGVAINFPSVDGVLVYSDSEFREFPTDEEKRDYLISSCRPYYINRNTGFVIAGPVGENQEAP